MSLLWLFQKNNFGLGKTKNGQFLATMQDFIWFLEIWSNFIWYSLSEAYPAMYFFPFDWFYGFSSGFLLRAF